MKMWHEARKQERKIRGMLVDYRKRAERRQDFYEKIKADPTQFMQIHGRKCKIHLDPAVAAAGDGSAIIVPWQGQQDNLIDRFDVRAHLDYIPPIPKAKELEDLSSEERQCNYERYRILAQNDFLGIAEDKFLHQLYLEEQFGANAQLENERVATRKKPATGAAIGYTYDDTDGHTPFGHILSLPTTVQNAEGEGESDSEVDMDVSIDISKLDTSQAHELNACGRIYGMKSNDYYSFLTKDADEADALRMAREEEQEKIMLSGRKSRRERRAQRERRFAGRTLSPPSYAAKEEPVAASKVNDNESDSRSPSPENSGKITYITSFGGEDDLQPHSKILININKPQTSTNVIGSQGNAISYADKVKENLAKLKQINEVNRKSLSPRKPMQYLRNRSSSRSSSRSRSRYRRRNSRTELRGYRGRRSRRRSSSYSRHSRNRSRSKSYHDRRCSRSRSPVSRNRHQYRSSSSYSSSSSSIHYKQSTSTNLTDGCKANPITHSKTRSKSPSPVAALSKLRGNARSSESPHKISLPSSSVTISEQNVSNKPTLNIEPPEAPIKRYYGRKRDTESSSSDELINKSADERPETSNSDQSNSFPPKSSVMSQNIVGSQYGKPSTSTTATSHSSYSEIKASSAAGTQNLRDRLKRKMQMLLNKQYKADKKAEIERTERQIQQQQEREDEMRELALKLRRRQRELRHKYGTPTSSPSKSSKNSESEHGDTSDIIEKIVEKPSRSKSRSPSRSHSIKYNNRDRSQRSRSITHRNQKQSRSPQRSRSRNRSPSRRRSRDLDYNRRHDRDNRRNRDDRNDRYSRDDRNRDSGRSPDYNRYRARDRNHHSSDQRDRHRYKSRERIRDRKDNSPKLQRRLVDY